MVLGETSHGATRFRRPVAYPAPPVAHALHDDDADVVDGDVAEAAAKPEPALPLGCGWRVPLTRVQTYLVYFSYTEIS